MQNMEWYQSLQQPPLTPPDNWFMPVWIVLYVMIGISFFVFLKSNNGTNKTLPIILFLTQLILNLSWSPVFFGMQKIGLALIILIFMWAFLCATIYTFFPHSKIAALLLVPYLLWTSFALYLNTAFFILNSNKS